MVAQKTTDPEIEGTNPATVWPQEKLVENKLLIESSNRALSPTRWCYQSQV